MWPLPLLALLLPGCSFGLELLLEDEGRRGGGPGDTAPDGDSDTDTDTDTDTDSDSDTDTDTDTDTDSDTDVDLVDIESIDPAYGTTAGGATVVISGGPFDNSSAIRFGTALGTRISWAADELIVETPAQSAEGQVDVKVTTAGGEGTLTSGFTYYEDGTNKLGIIGSMEWYHFVGGYWSETDEGSTAFYLSAPADLEYWEFYSRSLDSCESEYSYSGDIYYYEPALSSASLTTPTGDTLSYNWSSTDGQFFVRTLDSDYYVQGGSYDLDSMQPDGFPEFDVPNVLTLPSSFTVSSPAIGGSSVPQVRRSTFNLAWGGSGGDAMVAILALEDSAGTGFAETVTCAMRDDGSFTVPSATWTSWAAGTYVHILVGRMKMGSGTIPYNNADSGFAGIYWNYGIGLTQ